MPGVDFERVRSTVSMDQVLRLIGFTAKRTRGKQLRGPARCTNRHPRAAAASP